MKLIKFKLSSTYMCAYIQTLDHFKYEHAFKGSGIHFKFVEIKTTKTHYIHTYIHTLPM
jgi:hypothetical protein